VCVLWGCECVCALLKKRRYIVFNQFQLESLKKMKPIAFLNTTIADGTTHFGLN